jgi:hypothetical protein
VTAGDGSVPSNWKGDDEMRRQSSRKKAPPIKHTLRLYPGEDDALIDGLDQLANQPGKTINQVLKDGLCLLIAKPEQPDGRTETVVNLAEIRQVVESAVTQGLARFEGQIGGAVVSGSGDEDAEAEALLDDLGAALILAEDDDDD